MNRIQLTVTQLYLVLYTIIFNSNHELHIINLYPSLSSFNCEILSLNRLGVGRDVRGVTLTVTL